MEVKTNPFNDFPSPRDWGFTDKVIQWRKDHEGEITNVCEIDSHVKCFPTPPPTVFDDVYTITNAGAIKFATMGKLACLKSGTLVTRPRFIQPTRSI